MSSLLKIILMVVAVTVLVWLPFKLNVPDLPGWHLDFSSGMKKVWANFDGPNYLIIARTWYDKEIIRNNFSSPIPLEYYPAHLPLYPAVIWVFDRVLSGPWAMLVATLVGTIAACFMLLKYMEKEKINGKWWLMMVFLIFPARWLAVRSVGSPEPWFMLFILASLYQFKKGKYLWAGIWGALAQWTKSPAILLFGGYAIYWLLEFIKTRKFNLKMWPIILIPLSALALFGYYALVTGDGLAYFNSGDNFHLFFPPFSIFSPKGQAWVGDFWLEDIIWIWLMYGLGVTRLWRKEKKVEACFAGVFWLSTLFVSHRDISRYILPILPLMIIAYDDLLNKKEVKIVMAILTIPLFLFTWNFIMHNGAPIADWAPYL